jgi:hypothetical protein
VIQILFLKRRRSHEYTHHSTQSKTATEEFTYTTLHVFQTAPKPVLTLHPNKQAFSSDISFLILVQEISAKMVYSDMVEPPIKW